MIKQFSNEDAAGAVISIVAVFFLSSILFVIIGFGLDKVINSSILFSTVMPASQMRFDVLKMMLTVFRFEPILILLGAGLNGWVASIRTMSGDVDLSGMLWEAAELITGTLFIVAFTAYGGLAVEMVINIVNGSPVLGHGQMELFAAVQYILPVMYGCLFLALVGLIVLFLLRCVQVTDYGQQMPGY